jgi:hypothetical protein
VLSYGLPLLETWEIGGNVLEEPASFVFGYKTGKLCAKMIFIFWIWHEVIFCCSSSSNNNNNNNNNNNE